MWRLIKLAISLVVLGGFVYFAVRVPLGDKTLWEHAKAIASSKEAQHLADGVRKAIGGSAKGSSRGSAKNAPDQAPQEKLTRADQQKLRRAIRRLAP